MFKIKITKKQNYVNIDTGGGGVKLNDKKVIDENNVLQHTYPAGSVYITINSTSPASLFGGTWERLPEGYAIWTAINNAGSTLDAGLPNIIGQFSGGDTNQDNGAFKFIGGNGSRVAGGSAQFANHNFDASRCSTIYGKSDTVQPNAYKVYAWKRIA